MGCSGSVKEGAADRDAKCSPDPGYCTGRRSSALAENEFSLADSGIGQFSVPDIALLLSQRRIDKLPTTIGGRCLAHELAERPIERAN